MRLFRKNSEPTDGKAGDEVAGVLELAAARIDAIVGAAERAATDIRVEAEARLNSASGDQQSSGRERLVKDLAESLTARADDLRDEAEALSTVLGRASKRLAAPPASAVTAEVAEPTESDTPERTPVFNRPPKAQPTTAPSPVSGPEHESEPVAADSAPEAALPPISPNTLTDRVSQRFEGKEHVTMAPDTGRRVSFKRRGSSPVEAPTPEVKRPSNDGLRLLATQMAVAGSTREEIEARLRGEFGIEDASELFGDVRIPSSNQK